ncbi:MAG: hypothetical protein ACFE9Z_12530 [Promethearchaeota archaeon]
MRNINRIFKKNYVKLFYAITFICLLLIPILFEDFKLEQGVVDSNSSPIISEIKKEDYSALLSEDKQSLGNITVNDMDLNNLEPGFLTYNTTYPLIGEDHASGSLNMTRIEIEFIRTTEVAIQDNINEDIIDNTALKVKLNETFEVEYDNPQAGILLFMPRLRPFKILEVYVDDGSSIIQLINETDFIIDDEEFLVFNYRDYFYRNYYKFNMSIIWQYEFYVELWEIAQYSNQDLIIENIEQNFTIKFDYYFRVTGLKFGETINDRGELAGNVRVALRLYLPDKDLLDYESLLINNESVDINNHLNLNKSIDIHLSNNFLLNRSWVLMNFTSDFTIRFENPVDKHWAIDRLVAMANIRERIYLPSIVAGPRHIFVRDLSFYDYDIRFELILSTSSLFQRDFEFFPLNSSIVGREGIELIIPYIINDETCPSIVKYTATQTLRITIVDNIRMPLIGANVEIFYYGREYGTYISNDKVQPIATSTANENGEIVIRNVPYGNFTMKVYYNGIFIKEEISKTDKYNFYIYTNYPHIPAWLMIFGGTSGILLFIGIIIYLKNKNLRK